MSGQKTGVEEKEGGKEGEEERARAAASAKTERSGGFFFFSVRPQLDAPKVKSTHKRERAA
jgi:hypothetical protein